MSPFNHSALGQNLLFFQKLNSSCKDLTQNLYLTHGLEIIYIKCQATKDLSIKLLNPKLLTEKRLEAMEMTRKHLKSSLKHSKQIEIVSHEMTIEMLL